MSHKNPAGIIVIALILSGALIAEKRSLHHAPEEPQHDSDSAFTQNYAQTGTTAVPPSVGTSTDTLQTYHNKKYGFHLTYAANIQVYDTPADLQNIATVSYIPLCATLNTTACFYFPPAMFGGTNFEGAALSVSVNAIDVKSACLRVDGETVKIGDVSFHKTTQDGVALGHQATNRIYRARLRQRCVEIVETIETTSFDIYPSGTTREFALKDRETVWMQLDQILRSVRFDQH